MHACTTSTIVRTLAALASFLAGLAAAAPPSYHLTDVGVPPGYAGAEALAIGAGGDVLGRLLDPSEPSGIPFTWTAGGGMQVGKPARRTVQRTLSALGKHGQVVGWLDCHTCAHSQAFWWKPGSNMHYLPGLYDGAATEANGVNDRGVVVGAGYYMQASWHVVTWAPGGGVVDRTPDLADARASGINHGGQITGWMSRVVHDLPHAMLLDPDGHVTDLGIFPGGFYSFARAINGAGTIVGNGDDATDFKPFVWTAATGLRDIIAGTAFEGQWGVANDVNDDGEVVGVVGARAFWWSDAEGIHLLDDLVDPADPLAGQVAFDGTPHIDGAGRVAVSGMLGGVEHAFLMTPGH